MNIYELLEFPFCNQLCTLVSSSVLNIQFCSIFNNDIILHILKTYLTLMAIVKMMTMKAKPKTVITTATMAKMRMAV